MRFHVTVSFLCCQLSLKKSRKKRQNVHTTPPAHISWSKFRMVWLGTYRQIFISLRKTLPICHSWRQLEMWVTNWTTCDISGVHSRRNLVTNVRTLSAEFWTNILIHLCSIQHAQFTQSIIINLDKIYAHLTLWSYCSALKIEINTWHLMHTTPPFRSCLINSHKGRDTRVHCVHLIWLPMPLVLIFRRLNWGEDNSRHLKSLGP